jgi:23S rRNA (pseudouridine1915-N3)-methyltransferase
MKFVFPFLGRTGEEYLQTGIRDYARRLAPFVTVEIHEIKDKIAKNLPDRVQMQREGALLLDSCQESSFVVALDSGGRELDSPSLAALLDKWENRGVKAVHFLIGGHLGLHEDVVGRADLVLSLSRLTFTHDMCRLILLEQLYRAWMIKSGRRYHN